MRIVMLGVNHRTAPVKMRERLALSDERVRAVLGQMRERFPTAEAVVVSTCNRTEFYVARPTHEAPGPEELRALLAEQCAVGLEQLAEVSIHREQEAAVRHLFRVCTGIDSMVLGEPQILGQVKRAYELATQAGSVGPVLHRIFQQGIAAAKHVRQVTGIGQGRLSVASVAVDFARQIFEDFSDKTIVSIGAGVMTKAMLGRLAGLAPKGLWLVNRTLEPAQELWKKLGTTAGGVRPWEELEGLLVQADIVLTGTGAEEAIITAGQFKRLVRKRRGRPVFIVDVAVPRDVEPAVGGLNNVYLYNIDDLQSVVADNLDQRAGEVDRCEAHLAQAVDACMYQVRHRDIGHLVRQLRERLHAIGQQERTRTRRKLAAANGSGGSADIDRIVDEHTHRLINKILHLPLRQLDHRDADAPLGFYAAALRRLFDLQDQPFVSDGEADGKAEARDEESAKARREREMVEEARSVVRRGGG